MISLVYGDDNFRCDLFITRLKSELLVPGFESFNLVELKSPEPADLYNAVCSPAFGSGEKIVVIQDAKFLEAKADDEDLKVIMRALESKADGVNVIFKSKKVNGTLKGVKAIKKLDGVKLNEFKVFTPWQIKEAAGWIKAAVQEEQQGIFAGLKLNDQVAEFFVEYLGADDSSKLHSELKRLVTLDPNVTEELIEKECKPKHDIFKFSREFASGNIPVAQAELSKLVKSGEVNIGTLAALSTNVSKYLKLKLLESSRMSQDEQAKMLSVTSGRLYHMKKEVAQMKLEKLEKINSGIYEAECKVKTGKLSVDKALKLLIHST